MKGTIINMLCYECANYVYIKETNWEPSEDCCRLDREEFYNDGTYYGCDGFVSAEFLKEAAMERKYAK